MRSIPSRSSFSLEFHEKMDQVIEPVFAVIIIIIHFFHYSLLAKRDGDRERGSVCVDFLKSNRVLCGSIRGTI